MAGWRNADAGPLLDGRDQQKRRDQLATSYISAKGSNAVTPTHTATAGMSYDVACTVN